MSNPNGSMIRAVRGPLILITVGVLFALNNFTRYRFDQTWPVLLIVIGLLSIIRRGVEPPPPAPPPPPPPAYTGTGFTQGPYSGQPFPPPGTSISAGPAKGGFGTSAPPRPEPPPPSSTPEGGSQ